MTAEQIRDKWLEGEIPTEKALVAFRVEIQKALELYKNYSHYLERNHVSPSQILTNTDREVFEGQSKAYQYRLEVQTLKRYITELEGFTEPIAEPEEGEHNPSEEFEGVIKTLIDNLVIKPDGITFVGGIATTVKAICAEAPTITADYIVERFKNKHGGKLAYRYVSDEMPQKR